MKQNQTKGTIYIRTIGAFLVIYLILMTSFSIFLIEEEKQTAGHELGAFAISTNRYVEEVLFSHMDSNNQITDLSLLKKEFINPTGFYTSSGTEFALYSGAFELLFNTNDYWLCSYTEYIEGNQHYSAEGYINPQEWFSAEEVSELEYYLYAEPQAKEVGDLSGYSLSLEGLWVDNEMVIPHKIEVVPMYASSFDENGQVNSSSGTHTGEIIYLNDYKNDRDLPYFKHSSIQPSIHPHFDRATQAQLREKVLDKDRLKTISQEMGFSHIERVNLLNYHYYLAHPYKNTVSIEKDESHYSEFWTVLAREVNLWPRCASTLIFVWVSCLLVFTIVALLLARQTYSTYKSKEQMEKQRQEMTNALAHDLKTPLSIISGYAQNLMENVHTEKREQYAVNIQANVERMDGIIREMFDLSRLETDVMKIKYEEVSLNEVCAEIINYYQDVGEEKSITIQLDGDNIIKADADLIRRVINNFFINALDNTPEGGRISIRITADALELYNSGSHIPADIINEIWQPHIKGDLARSKTKGSGLGLAIAGNILDRYKFTYGAKNLEDGVVFWFKFI